MHLAWTAVAMAGAIRYNYPNMTPENLAKGLTDLVEEG
jgi:hypothetical protein